MFIVTLLLILCCHLEDSFCKEVEISNIGKSINNDNIRPAFLDNLETVNTHDLVTSKFIETTQQTNIFDTRTTTVLDGSKQKPTETSDVKNTTKTRKDKRQRRPSKKEKKIDTVLEEYTTTRSEENESTLYNTNNIKTTKETLKNDEILKASTNAYATTFAPTTFPKRPPEFNPVFKKRTRERDPVVRIIDEKNYVYGHNGDFHYSFEGGDGTKVFSQGELSKTAHNVHAGESVVGGFFYKDKDGSDYSISYMADENGYRPVGAHLPTPPPIPPAIARALQYLATKPTPLSGTYDY